MLDYDIIAVTSDGLSPIIKVQATNPAMAFQTALYSILRWSDEEKMKLIALRFEQKHPRGKVNIISPRVGAELEIA